MQGTVAILAMTGLVSLFLFGKQWLSHHTESIQSVNRHEEIFSTGTAPAPSFQNAVKPTPSEPDSTTYKESTLSEVRRFLAFYGLEKHSEAFSQALETGFGPIEQRIWQESGYRLVDLPEQTTNIKGRYRILRQTSADGVVHRLLFWQPSYWIDSFAPGERSEKILALQKQLAQINFYHTNPDGIIGNQTVTSLTGFQKRHRLPVTRRPDATTLFLLSQIAGDLQWGIQIASLQRKEDALSLISSLSRKGFKGFVQPLFNENGQAWQVVRVGPLASYAAAKTQQQNILSQLNLTGRIVQFPSIEQNTTRKG